MKIWHYHPITNELAGEGTADANPVEEGEWLWPAFSTPVAPPERQEGCAVVFAGTSWTQAPDHRGEVWWPAGAEDNTTPVLVDFIGDPAARELTDVEPPAPAEPVPPTPPVTARQIRLALNQLGCRAAVEAYIAEADQDTRDSWQFGSEFFIDEPMVMIAAHDLDRSEELPALFALAKTL